MNILLLSTGSVSAYLSHKLAYQFKEDRHKVKYYMTKVAGADDDVEQCKKYLSEEEFKKIY